MDAVPKILRVIVTVIDADGHSALYDLKDPITFMHSFEKVGEEILWDPVTRAMTSKIKFSLEAVVDGQSPAYISTYPVEGT